MISSTLLSSALGNINRSTTTKVTSWAGKRYFSILLATGRVRSVLQPFANVQALKQVGDVDYWDSDDPMPRKVLLSKAPKADAIMCVLSQKMDKELLAAAPNLKVISTMSAGVDHIDLDECKLRKIKVGNTPGVLTNTTADLIVGLLLATARRIPEASSTVYNGGWAEDWKGFWMCGMDVYNSSIGIIGMGKIGQAVAKRLRGFDCQIMYHGPREHPDLAAPVNAVFYPNIDAMLAKSDFVIPLCPLTPATKNLFNADRFRAMKKGAIFINASRGKVVDQDALIHALKSGHLAAAGLDVMDPEPLPQDHALLDPSLRDRLVLLPHIGSASIATRTKMADIAVTNLINGISNKPMLHPIL